MKGDYEYLNITFALLIFMGTIVFIVLMIRGNIVSFSGGVASDIDKMRAIESSHMVEYCLTTIDGGDSNYMLYSTLEKYSGKTIRDVCGIENPTITAEVFDAETLRSWGFDMDVSEPDHVIWVSILYDNLDVKTVSMGKLHVKI